MRERLLNSVHGSFAKSVIVRGGGAILAVTANILLARLLGVTEYGRYMTLFSTALLLGSLTVRGTDQVLTRELAGGEGSARSTLTRWAIGRVARSAILAVAVYLTWVLVSEHDQSAIFVLSAALSGALLIALFAFCTLQAGALNGLGMSLRSQALLLVVRNAGLLAMILGAMLWSLHSIRDAEQALWLQVGSFVLALAAGWSWLRALARDEIGDAVAGVAPVAMTRRWSVASRHFILVTVAAMLVNRFDVVLVSALAGNETAGVYAAGARLAQVALMVALAVNVVLSPRFAAAWAHGDNAAVRRLLRSGLAFTVPIALIEVLTATVFGQNIVALFGPAYALAAAPFAWVTLAYALWTVAAPGYAMLSMTGSEKIVAGISWLVLITNATAILVLVPLQGATGAGIAMTAGYALALPVLAISAKQKMKASVARDKPSENSRVKASNCE